MQIESQYARKIENEKVPKDLWARVSEAAVSELSDEDQARARFVIDDPEFKKIVKERWNEHILSENIDSDPEKQEELWARGLTLLIKGRLNN